MLALLLTFSAAVVDTCRFDLPGTVRRNPDAPILAQPLFAKEAVDSLGMYVGWLFLGPGTVVPEHEHDGDEVLFVVCGGARFRVNGKETGLTQGASLRVPKGNRHAAIAGAQGMVAVQVYRPGGAGLRFYDWPEGPPP
ncbi:MAG: cupin domain-containing protein [Gemmatimonadales bacterium]